MKTIQNAYLLLYMIPVDLIAPYITILFENVNEDQSCNNIASYNVNIY